MTVDCRKIKNTKYSGIYGPNGAKVVDTITRISLIDWFSKAGNKENCEMCNTDIINALSNLSMDECPIVWIDKAQLVDILEQIERNGNRLWDKTEKIKEYMKEVSLKTERASALSTVTNGLSELILLRSYAGVVTNLTQLGEKTYKVSSEAVMNAVSAVCAWDTMGDLPGGWKVNPFDYLLKVFECGHWPLGIVNNVFYVL